MLEMPPALPMFVAALALPLLPLTARRALAVLAPLLGLAAMYSLPAGVSWTAHFLGYALVFARVDSLSLVFGLVFLVTAAIAGIYGWHRTAVGEQAAALIYAGGGLTVVFAGDMLTMFMAWEIMAVASTFLVFARRRPASLAAGQRYLMIHLAGGGILLLGVLLLSHTRSSAEFGVLSGLGAGSWLVLLAFCINAAVPPLHPWLPDAYPEGSISGSVFLSAYTTKAAVYCLIRAFPGTELLMWAGAVMAVYGVVFAVMENNIRRLLAYHIVSQVGYMVCGVGIGTEMGLNGAAAHAFCHILYKGLLFMGAGAVLYSTGRDKLTELGGLARQMPWTFILYMVGAFSISGVPLFNGFISKSLVIAAAEEAHHGTVVALLQVASVGTFLSVALKLPYFAWFASPPKGEAKEAPRHMLIGMGLAAALCIALGVAPGWLYARLPFPPVDYHPYNAAHVFEMLLMVSFTAVAFWWWLERMRPHDVITLDTDWFYRRPAAWFVRGLAIPLDTFDARLGALIQYLADLTGEFTRNPTIALERFAERGEVVELPPPEGADQPGTHRLPAFDEDRQRPPVAWTVVWVLTFFVILGVAFLI